MVESRTKMSRKPRIYTLLLRRSDCNYEDKVCITNISLNYNAGKESLSISHTIMHTLSLCNQ
jgi:hypothetical protein